MKKNVFIFVLLFILLWNIALADPYRPYLHQPVIPKENLDSNKIFETDLFTGAATFTYPIDVPKGTNGLKSSLNLLYNSHLTNQVPRDIGNGWFISKSYIQRKINHTLTNVKDDWFELILDGFSYKLVYENESRYLTNINNFRYITNKSGGQNEKGIFWEVVNKEGMTFRFGYDNSSELISNGRGVNYTWRWNLDLVRDTHNNSIFYNYTENKYSGDMGVAYLDNIKYNNDKNRIIDFVYETSDRSDLWWGAYEEGIFIN